jgi:hypothetical protein
MLDIQFNDQAGDEDDNNNDAVKVNGSDFNFYTIASNNSKLSIDVRAFRENGVIPIGINSHYAQDFIIRTDLLNIGNSGNLYLHDKLLNQYVLLTKGSEYKFSVSNDAKSQGDNRFELKMAPAEAVNTTDGLNVTIQPNPAREQTVVSFTANGKDNVEMNIIDLTGVNVFHKQLGVKTSGSVTVPLDKIAAGLYLIEVSSGGSKVIQKLVKE